MVQGEFCPGKSQSKVEDLKKAIPLPQPSCSLNVNWATTSAGPGRLAYCTLRAVFLLETWLLRPWIVFKCRCNFHVLPHNTMGPLEHRTMVFLQQYCPFHCFSQKGKNIQLYLQIGNKEGVHFLNYSRQFKYPSVCCCYMSGWFGV